MSHVNMTSDSDPYKPDEAESAKYFFGFAGNPRLVARTSSNRWTEPQQEVDYYSSYSIVQVPKRYAAITEGIIIDRWGKDVDLAIIEALKPCAWNYFFPVKIGLERGEYWVPSIPSWPTVLLIAVEPDSLQWVDGIAVALECRKILGNFGIAGIEVEICEGQHTHHAASAKIEAEFMANPRGNTWFEPFSGPLGYPVAYLEDREGQGTMGLHLRLGDESSPVYGLTCRHVVSHDRPRKDAYRVSGEHRQYHIQGGEYVLNEAIGDLEYARGVLQGRVDNYQSRQDRWDTWYVHDETMQHRRLSEKDMEEWEAQKKHIARFDKKLELLTEIKERKARVIGHLAFHPSSEMSLLQPGYLRDWALIELDPLQFKGGFENKMWMGCGPKKRVLHWIPPEGEFRTLRLDASTETSVAKRGMKTGLTSGAINGIEAVVRRPYTNGDTVNAWQLLIVPDPEYTHFSERGDSGACIFDVHGVVVGMVIGGSGNKPHGSDSQQLKEGNEYKLGEKERVEKRVQGISVTFAAPIQWVLDDIENFTGLKPRLCAEDGYL
ncbi:hypothetical protein F5Y14DRAFT_457984 [Nemania sp. NC0429]|nr:hypothetical protein F5Y14DRAFT_457984 [Nemania sp. NC0429]